MIALPFGWLPAIGGLSIPGSPSAFGSILPFGWLVALGGGPTTTVVPATPYRDRDVYLAIKALLKAATHDGKPAFDRVTLGKPAYAQRIKSDDASWVDIQPLSDGTTSAGSPSREFHRPSFVLTIGVRDTDDPEVTYVSRLDRLTAIVRNTLLSPANRTFGGLVLSGYTKLSDGSIGASGYPGMTRTLHGEFAYEVSLASSGYSTVF